MRGTRVPCPSRSQIALVSAHRTRFTCTPFPSQTFLLVRSHFYLVFSYVKEDGIMAEVEHAAEEQSLEKAVWHYVGVAVMWLSLFLSGLACERLGLTSFFLT